MTLDEYRNFEVDVVAECGHRAVATMEGRTQEEADTLVRVGPCTACFHRASVLKAWAHGVYDETELQEWVGAVACESAGSGDDRLARLIDAVRTIV